MNIEEGIQSVRESLYPYECSVEEMIEFGLLEIDDTLSGTPEYSLESVILEATKKPLKVPEGEIKTIKQLVNYIMTLDNLPDTNPWLIGIFCFVCIIYSSCVIGGLSQLMTPFVHSTALSLGVLPLIVAIGLGAIKFGFDALDYIVTAIWNKITNDKQLPLWHKVQAMSRMTQAYHKMIYEVKYGPDQKLAKKVMKRYYQLRKEWKEKHLKEGSK